MTTLSVALLGALVLLSPAVINGGPFVYFDSAAYLDNFAKALSVLWGKLGWASRDAADAMAASSAAAPAANPGGEDNIVQGGRSIYYSAFASTGRITVWLPIFLQCLVIAWLVTTLFRGLLPRTWQTTALIAFVFLACCSSLALFANLIMPDVWAGAAIIALALLWSPGAPLSRAEKWGVGAVLCFSALAHSSHIALIAAMCLAYAVIRLSGRAGPRGRPAFALPAIAVLAGVLGQLAFGLAVQSINGTRPLERPHITAHLVDLGPGTAFAHASCPESGYALCAFRDKLPVDWIAFMFSRAEDTAVFAVADTRTKQELADEQLRFAIDTVKAYPAATLGGLSLDGIRQLWTLSVADVPQSSATPREFVDNNFSPAMARMIQDTVIYDRPDLARTMTRMIEITTAASLVLLLVWSATVYRAGRSGLAPGTGTVVATVLGGVLLNALICGILASPYGRFQARVVWLLPMLVILVAAATLEANRSRKNQSVEV